MRVSQEQSKICPEQNGAQSVVQDTAQDCTAQDALRWSCHLVEGERPCWTDPIW